MKIRFCVILPSLIRACLFSLIVGTLQAQEIEEVELINAESNVPILAFSPLVNDAVIDIAELPSGNVNLNIKTTGTIGSVGYQLSGAENQTGSEGVAPYAIFGDNAGNYNNWAPTLGMYTLTVTPYSGANASGTAGTPLTINFTVTNSGSSEGGGNAGGGSSGNFIEEGGLLVMEAESATLPANWNTVTAVPANDPTMAGFTGDGYIEWTGAQFFGLTIPENQANGVITYSFTITNPGTYSLRWRTKQKNAGQAADAGNDSFVRYASGTNPAGATDFSQFTKIFIQNKTAWDLNVRAEPRKENGNAVFVTNAFKRTFTAGTHSIQLAARSPGHAIDRFILHRDDVPFNAVTFASAPESARDGAGNPGDGGNPPVIPPGASSVLQTPAAGIYGELKQWHRVTTAFEGPALAETGAANPFNDYRLDVTFQHTASGQQITVPGYYAADGQAGETGSTGGSIWRAHLRPWETGQWTYTSRFINGTNAAISNTGNNVALVGSSGSFNVGESDKLGVDFRNKGRLTYVGKYHLQFSGNGEYFLKYGADSPENLLSYADIDNTPVSLSGERNTGIRHTWQPHVVDWRSGDPEWKNGKGRGVIGAMNFLRERGAKSVSMLLYSTDGGDDGRVFPWIGKNSKGRFDVSKLDQWEVIFEHANASGLNLSFKLAEEENWPDTSGNDLTRYYREMVARFGHHLGLTWIISEEYGGFGNLNASEITELKRRGSLMADLDTWDNNLVTHTGPSLNEYNAYEETVGEPTFTGASLQVGSAPTTDNVFNYTLRVRNWSRDAGRPWIVANDEQGPAGSGVLPDVEGNRERIVWGNIMAGGAGLEFYVNNNQTNYDAALENWRELDHMWTWGDILINGLMIRHQVPFWDMENQDSLLSPSSNANHCLALSDDTYLIYLRNGGSANLNLSASSSGGSFEVKWYDPRNGGELQNGSVLTVQGGGVRALGSAPNSGGADWAVLVRNTNSIPADLGPYNPDTFGNCPVAVQLFARDFPTAGNNFYLDEAALLTDITNESALAIDPSNATSASTSLVYSGPAGRYDLVLRTVGENDGSSSFVLKINGVTIGAHNPPLSSDVFEVGSRYNVRYNNVQVSPGDTITVDATIASIDGEFSRARWLGIDFLTRCSPGGTGNFAPNVNAGQTITSQFVANPSSVVLQAVVTDDGLPDGGMVSQTWSKISGPGTVSFADPMALRTLATFSEQGTYVLRLTASDSELVSTDNVTVNITTAAGATDTEFTSVDDAFLENGVLRNDAELRVENSGRTRISYLKFDLSSLSGTADSVTLRLTEGTDVSGGQMTLRFYPGETNAWTETTLSSANAPAKGAEFATWTGNLTNGAVVDVDASSLVSGAGIYSIVVEADSSNLDLGFSSKEGSAAPRLIVSQAVSTSVLNITNPSNGVTVNSSPSITVQASADPVSASFSAVELFYDGVSQGISASPFSWDVPSPSTGSHNLVVVGRAAGGQTVSSSSEFTVVAGGGEYSQWLEMNFDASEQLDSAVSGLRADPGGNGLPNVVDYALGLDPKGQEGVKLDVADVSSSSFSLSYMRKAGDRAGVSMKVQYSDSLNADWLDEMDSSVQVSAATGGMEMVVHAVPRSAGISRRFYRLFFEE